MSDYSFHFRYTFCPIIFDSLVFANSFMVNPVVKYVLCAYVHMLKLVRYCSQFNIIIEKCLIYVVIYLLCITVWWRIYSEEFSI